MSETLTRSYRDGKDHHTLQLLIKDTHKKKNLHESIRMYMGVLILGVYTLYTVFCLVWEIPMVWKGLRLLYYLTSEKRRTNGSQDVH